MALPELLKAGRLEEALAELQAGVRSAPADAKLRIFLSQLLMVMGQWDRALTQLRVSAELDAGAIAMARTYEAAIQCESLRREVFAGRRQPLVLGDPEPWIAHALEAVARSGAGDHAAAAKLRESAWADAPATSGRVDGRSFEWISDADSRLGPLLEANVDGKYYWIPLHRIARIDVEPPTDLRDLVWMPVHFVWTNGGDAVGFLPTRYPGSEASADPEVRMARKTEWTEVAPGEFHGLGQRTFATDGDDCALMDVRAIEFDAAGIGGDAASSAASG